MKNATTMAQLAVEDMSASEAGTFFKWLQKRVPAKVEAETTLLRAAEDWWLAKLKSGDMLPGRGWLKVLPIETLTADYITELERHELTVRGSATAMGRFLKKVCPKLDISSMKADACYGITRKRPRHYLFPGLDACRAVFEEAYGAQDWTDSGDSGDSADQAQKGDSQYPDGE